MKYSIIIPHYNIPHLLQRAINSIPNREDLEIIIIDDFSSEQNKLELRKICKEDSRQIKLLEHSNNKGGGAARNSGMDIAEGEFVLFLDADDFFNDCIDELMTEYADDRMHDVIFFKANSVDNETLVPKDRLNYLNDEIDEWLRNPDKGEVGLRYFFGVPVCKIIRRSVIIKNNLRFDETRIHNDTTFAYMLGYAANRIVADPRAGYCATVRSGSVSRQQSDELQLVTINILGREVLFFREKLNKNYSEDQLCFNLYILLRKKSYDSFKKGIDDLVKLGFSRDDIFHIFSRQMAMDSLKSSIWIILFSPIFKIRLFSFMDIFKYIILSSIKQVFTNK